MDFVESFDFDSKLFEEIQYLAELMHIDFDDYITLLLEEEILNEISKSLVSDSSIY